MSTNWIKITDGDLENALQCTLCDYYTFALHLMLGHQATEHIKRKPSSKRKKKDAENKLPLKGIDNGRFIP